MPVKNLHDKQKRQINAVIQIQTEKTNKCCSPDTDKQINAAIQTHTDRKDR